MLSRRQAVFAYKQNISVYRKDIFPIVLFMGRKAASRVSPPTPESFFTWLEDMMAARDLNDRRLSMRAGISCSVLSKARTSAQPIGFEACLALAKALYVPATLVFQKAGLLPPAPLPPSREVSEFEFLFAELPEADQEDLLMLARLKAQRQQRLKHGETSGSRRK
jgi:transcriptional regulator with XRE-family HTH domain